MKRAEKKYWERVYAGKAAKERAILAERLAIKALLDQHNPDSERLVRDMKHPLFIDELRAHGKGPTGVTYTTDVVQRYSRIIARHTGGDALGVKQYFQQLIGEEQAEKLGINLGKLKISNRSAPGGGTIVDIKLSDHDVVAIAEYLTSPDHLNLGNLPPNPFGNPRLTNLLDSLRNLQGLAQIAPSNPYNGHGGPTSHQLRYQVAQDVGIVANEISRAMPNNSVREAALKAMRLDGCLDIYTPQVVRRTGWQDIQISETDPVTVQPLLSARRIPVYGTVPGAPGDPTRYRVRNPEGAAGQLLDWYHK